jgi:hypothetical protein
MISLWRATYTTRWVSEGHSIPRPCSIPRARVGLGCFKFPLALAPNWRAFLCNLFLRDVAAVAE